MRKNSLCHQRTKMAAADISQFLRISLNIENRILLYLLRNCTETAQWISNKWNKHRLDSHIFSVSCDLWNASRAKNIYILYQPFSRIKKNQNRIYDIRICEDIWWIVSCVLFEKPYFGRTILGAYTRFLIIYLGQTTDLVNWFLLDNWFTLFFGSF